MENFEWLQILIGAATCIILFYTLKAVLRYTRSAEEQTKAIIEQTEIGFQQTKAVIEQAKLIQRQMALTILPSFQIKFENIAFKAEGEVLMVNEKTIIIQNIGKGVALNISVLTKFENTEEDHIEPQIHFIEFLSSGANHPIPLKHAKLYLRKDFDNIETTFIFADILGNRYSQVHTKTGRFSHRHGFVEPLPRKEKKDQ